MKVIALFYSKYEKELVQGHVPPSEMESFVTKAIVAKGSTIDIGRGPG